MVLLPTRPHTIKLALRSRRVNPTPDPGGSGKELVGKGSGAVGARLAILQFSKGNPCKNQAKRKVRKPQILAPIHSLKSNTFCLIFKNTFTQKNF